MKKFLQLSGTAALLIMLFCHILHAEAATPTAAFGMNNSMICVPDIPDTSQNGDLLCGDVSGDGVVNVLDIISMVSYIMGSNPSPFGSDAADINADGVINILDVIALVNNIMQVPGVPCGCVAPVLYEGQTYTTVQIGGQCWFRENLNVGTMIQSNQGGQLQTNNNILEKYCFDNDEVNCDTLGGLYEWNEAMQYVSSEGAQGICPVGWHIPMDEEIKLLEGTVDSHFLPGDPQWDQTGWRGQDAGGNLKESGMEHWNEPNTAASNTSGFTCLPGGYRLANGGTFLNINKFSYHWSSSSDNSTEAWRRSLGFDQAGSYRYTSNKMIGFSVRCLKGCWPEPTQASAGPDQMNVTGTSTTLAGNTPEYGTGIWHIVSGTGGVVADISSPVSSFTGMADSSYSLSWTITTPCGNSSDTVVISLTGSFTCGDDLEYAGQSYATVLIGTQCWMAGNLNIGQKINSTMGGYQQTDNGTLEKYCYGNDDANCSIYGGLYEWPEAMQYATGEGAQGICPAGWHIPTDDEWKVLEGTADTQYGIGDPVWDNIAWRGYDAGGNLKETGFIHWYDPNTGAANSFGFTGLPGGYRYYLDGYSYFMSSNGYFWSSSQSDASNAWFRSLGYDNAGVYRLSNYKDHGFSVRCLMGCWPQPTQANAGPDQLNVPGTSATLAGNIPVNGTGLWAILSGSGGTITDPTSPASEFQGVAGNEYTLSWTITTACGNSADTAAISFATASFACGNELEYGGQSYATVLIGDQCWMTENLNVGTMIYSTGGGQQQLDNGVIEKYCQDGDPVNCDIYGGLYEWKEAMQYVNTEGAQGICPAEWHIPTDGEWKILEGNADSQYPVGDPQWDLTGWRGSDAGGNLKEEGIVHWTDPNVGGTNASGFTGLPGGYRAYNSGWFYLMNAYGDFWTSSQYNATTAWARYLYHSSKMVNRYYRITEHGFSVRCLKSN
ncbi:MAG TPA: FISUMP domain-containing protein [Bacteroidales bacterium]|nr:FISUMP domain-containing protein [Bacteroidales bacterium]